MTKFASLKKTTQKLLPWKEILRWMIWNSSVTQQKRTLTCLGLYRLIFQFAYHTSLILPKRETDETVYFRNFRKLLCGDFFAASWHPIFKREKWNEVTRHMKHAAMTVTGTLEKLM